MASNFFEQQDVARKKTGQLVALFVAAVIGITLLVYALVVVALLFVQDKQDAPPGAAQVDPPYLAAFAVTVVGVLIVVGGCSFYKISVLRSGGGESVARTLGGRLLQPDATALHERKVLNVVEEMALASGTPVPPVYVMEHEPGINAFAAGYSPDNAVIGVTRGAIEQLSRDELQGVIAHEFSHILNGDMRINIRLMGVIFGIIAIGVIGRVLLRAALYSGGGRSKKDGRAVAAMIGFGLALFIIGGIGVFFGRLIQAAVSRQREFLADASAVQFTRNPDSIGGALKRIGGIGSSIRDGHAGEASHMFIASAASSWGFGPFATHPPIEQRIKRVDPAWDGSYPEPREVKREPEPLNKQTNQAGTMPGMPDAFQVPGLPGRLPGAVVGTAVLGEAAVGGPATSDASAVDQIGIVTASHVAYMRELIGQIPARLKDAAHEPYGARAVVCALLLDTSDETKQQQLKHLDEHADPAVAKLTRELVVETAKLTRAARLPLIDLAVPALRELSPDQYASFSSVIKALIKADGRVDLFEWTLQRLLIRHLDAHFKPSADTAVQYYNLRPLAEACAVVLSALVHVGHRDPESAESAFESAALALGVEGLSIQARADVKLSRVGSALDQLLLVSLREKKKLVTACAQAIAADGKVSQGEGELMRAIADALGVPMPPILPGQALV